jgi:hypothetical protein
MVECLFKFSFDEARRNGETGGNSLVRETVNARRHQDGTGPQR